MSEKITSAIISRRRALSLLGLATALSLAVPAAVLTVSDAEAQQAGPPVAPPTGTPTAVPGSEQTGTERRQKRRTSRTERRQERRTSRAERRTTRRTGRKERRTTRRTGGTATPQ